MLLLLRFTTFYYFFNKIHKASPRRTVSYCFPEFPGALLGILGALPGFLGALPGFPGSPGVRSQKVGEFEEVGEGSRKLEKVRGVWRKLQEVGKRSKFEKV